MAITSATQAIQAINSALLVDGPNIKQLLLDLSTFLQSAASLPAATTSTIGGVKEAANVTLTAGGTDTVTATNLANVRTALVNAGIMVGP